MDKKKMMLKRGVSVLLSLIVCLSLMTPTFGDSSGASSSNSSVEAETTITTQQISDDQDNTSTSVDQTVDGTLSSETASQNEKQTNGDISSEIETTDSGSNGDTTTEIESESDSLCKEILSVDYEPCVRFYARFKEEYTLASDNGNVEGVLLSDLPQLNVCITPYAEMYNMNLSISPMMSDTLNFTTTEQGNGSSCINGTGNLSSHRLYTIAGTGTIAFCVQHGAASPNASITYTWNGEYANSSIAAILDYTKDYCYNCMTYDGTWLSAEYVRQAVQIAIYCFTNDWNYTSVSTDSIWATNQSGTTGDVVLSLCKYLVNSIAPQGSSSKYAIYRPSTAGYQIMITPAEYEPGEPETPPEPKNPGDKYSKKNLGSFIRNHLLLYDPNDED